MSKLDIGVGEDFPLDEDQREHSHLHRRHGRHHWHQRHHHYRGHHHHRRRPGIGRLAFLLIVAGLAALLIKGAITASAAYGMIGAGIGIMLLSGLVHAIWHWRHRRSHRAQVA